jgi:hypothetical protein
MSIRPSLLPKIAECACYESEAEAGAAADRGNEVDFHFRAILSSEGQDRAEAIGKAAFALDEESASSLTWACEMALLLAGDHKLLARDEDLRIEACGMTGTADLSCPAGQWSADLKTGQIRNYREQQAAYALGFMDKYFEDEWTVYLLFCDQREYVRLQFTREEAEKLIREQIARRNDPQKVPTPCDYCGWCANRFRCIPRLEQAMPLVPVVESENPEQAFELILADNEKAVAFIRACKTIEDMQEKAREVIKDRLIVGKAEGLKIPGVSLVTKKGNHVFPAEALAEVGKKIGPTRLLKALGSISKSKAEALFAEAGMELPTDKLIDTAGSTYIQVR